MDIKNKIFHGHVLNVLPQFPNDCIDVVVTSPPYYSARFYGKEDNTVWDVTDPNCEHEWIECSQSKVSHMPLNNKAVDDKSWMEGHTQSFCKKCGAFYGQLGQEPTPMLFIKHLADIFDDVKRVLKPTGILFLNMGDTYCGSAGGFADKTPNMKSRQSKFNGYFASSVIAPPAFTCVGKEEWLKAKQLMLIPSRLAIEMQDRGWILRQDIIWKKLSGLPSTARDRFDNKYEHIFMFVKEPYYFFDTGKARKPYANTTIKRKDYVQSKFGGDGLFKCGSIKGNSEPTFTDCNPNGALKSDVWEIHTANTHLKHFAAFSPELVEECIKPACPTEVCSKCGSPKTERFKIIVRNFNDLSDKEKKIWSKIEMLDVQLELKNRMKYKVLKKKVSCGFVKSCKCKDTLFERGVVLDPFCGSGTTVITAKRLGFNYCGIEMNSDYIKLIEKQLGEML